ncbi:hypothetical protein [uncultured Methylophaga sp.]|uniref:hypothetical protein n=2 Tax=Methylophaga TaxID=40222 RepID=UPI0030F52E1D
MSMEFKNKNIESLTFPKELVSVLSGFNNKILSSLENDGTPIESGIFSIGKLEGDDLFVYTIFIWCTSINEIIDSLNLVINDLISLPDNYLKWSGAPETRIYLLVRTYFNEFFRSREVFTEILHGLKSQGKLTKEEVKSIKSSYHIAVEGMIATRNRFVHSSPGWKGKDHFDLVLVEANREKGMSLASEEIRDILNNNCQRFIPIFYSEGMRMRDLMQKFMNDMVLTLRN